MVNNKLFYLPVLGMAILSLIGMVIFETVLSNWFQQYIKNDMEVTLNTAVVAVQRLNPGFTLEKMDPWLDNLPMSDEKHRFTVTKLDGHVIGDSRLRLRDITALENQSIQPEISEAIEHGYGSSIRYSNTLHATTLFISKRFEHDGFTGIMRISTPLSYINTLMFELEAILGGIMFLSLLIMLLLAIVTNRYIQKHLSVQQESQELRIREGTREIELLQRLASMLAACNTVAEAQQVVEDVIPRILGHLNGAVSMIRSSRNQLEIKLDWGGDWPGAHSYAPEECWALRKGKPHLANDQFTSLPCIHMNKVGNNQTLCVPLIAHGNTIGIMHLYLADQAEQAPHGEWMQLAFTVGEHLGLALANLNLQEELREQTIRDPLTGLHNRRYLEETLSHTMMRARRHQQSLALLMLDMDHFKRFNDTFGHDAGDYVLKSLGSIIIHNVRGEDITCRIGGEELAVALPDTGLEGAIIVAEKFLTAVRDMHLEFNKQALGQLTLSIGIAIYPEDATEADDLLKRADIALYQSKDNGRDQWSHCIPEAEQSEEEAMTDNEEPIALIQKDVS